MSRLYVFTAARYYETMVTVDCDERMPYVLKKRNIARIERERLVIGDRRAYPFERTFVACDSSADAVAAIKGMVTQGGGPLQVSLTAMEWLACRMERGDIPCSVASFAVAFDQLKSSRPTNTTMARTLDGLLGDIRLLFAAHPDAAHRRGTADAIRQAVHDRETSFNAVYERMGRSGASLIADGERILTTCFAEHSFLLSLLFARDEGRMASVMVSETRPYFQGARLTAPSLKELGFDVTLICDGMGARFIEDGTVGRYMTAADLVCADGTVVNKTGTLANAVCARTFGIPYHAFSMAPDLSRRTRKDIVMEERDGADVCLAFGHPTTESDIFGRYPAFDIVPPAFVTSIITAEGVFEPEQIGAHEFHRPGDRIVEET